MAEPIGDQDNFDEETLALPISAEDATALAVILTSFIEENKGLKINLKLPDYDDVVEMNTHLVAKAEFLLKEVLEVCRYFLKPEEKETKKIIMPKPDWKNGTSI